MQVIKAFHRKDDRTKRIRIVVDEYAEDPWTLHDHVTEIMHWHVRYQFPGEWLGESDEVVEEVRDIVEGGGVAFPLFMLDHSGVSISVEPYGCPWDSGQFGFAVIRGYLVTREFNGDKELAKKCIRGEIEEYDAYMKGEVYGYQYYRIEKCECCGNTEEVDEDSCWGFYGCSPEEVLSNSGMDLEEWEEI